MKYFLFLLALMLPSMSYASQLSNCDKKEHQLLIKNAGETKVVNLAPGRSISVFGPMVDVSVDGKPYKRLYVSYDYCVWKSDVTVQSTNRLVHGGYAW